MALIRYQVELLVRSQRWLPPFLAYVLLMVLGISGGEEASGALGFSAAVVLPVTAWFTRCAVTAEPASSRACLVAAAGAARVHVAALLAGLLGGLAVGAAGYGAVLALSGKSKGGPGAILAGAVATAVCVLLGAAVGAVFNRPVVTASQYGIPLSLAAATLVLVVPGSPANAVVRVLIAGSRGTEADLVPLAWALPAAVAAAALAFWGAANRAQWAHD